MSFLSLVLLYEPISDLVVFLFPDFDGDAISMAFAMLCWSLLSGCSI